MLRHLHGGGPDLKIQGLKSAFIAIDGAFLGGLFSFEAFYQGQGRTAVSAKTRCAAASGHFVGVFAIEGFAKTLP